ncbi:venom carboxylesterase-6-like [Diorhabda carinulata]|uniref:venom carboxylesterase-6-like n=1 Tax=Diorhabda carinulata TaxID=1163345 RepID=UPI0025A076B8|nr:venom carboxylesterase-6-like [Diorhabda carinulata]
MLMVLQLIFIFIRISTCTEYTPTYVKLPLGTIEGYVGKTVKGREYNAFEGVPYAAPPVGDLRFQEPVPPKPWLGIWKARTIFRCIQYYHYTPSGEDMVIGDEDCLYLNIYTPNLNTTKKMNVMVFIHGGAFMFNLGGVFGPQIFLDQDVVYVNLNYRLGPLGFLSTEDELVPGNNGIRDQVRALEWIQENIEYFGGNPESVTIMGMSAGGASVQTHYLIKQSKGLFAKGISQSGTVLNPWVLMEDPLKKSQTVASHVGCPTENNEEMVNCLKTKPARQIVHTMKHFQPWLYNPFSPFALVVDSWAKDPIFPEHPLILLRKGLVKNLPWITSYTSSEGLYPGSDFYFDEYLDYLDKRWNYIMPYILHYNDVVPASQLNQIGTKIRLEYLKNKEVGKRNFEKFIQILSDRLFLRGIETASRLQAAATESPVYCYYFNYRGVNSKSNFRTYSDVNLGVSHGDDTSYIFKTNMDTLSTENDRAMSDIMINLVISFMETGKPNTSTEWKPLSRNLEDPWVQLRIDGPEKIFIEEKTDIGNKKFWENLPFAENENLFPAKDEL